MDRPEFDVVTVGETMLRLSPTGRQRLEQARTFEVGVGGTELNTAVSLARLGLLVSWVSRLPDGPLGRIVLNQARLHGVDVSAVTLVPDVRMGLMFYEPGASPHPAAVYYDRKNSPAAGMSYDPDLWSSLLAGSRWVHLTGITAALSDSCRELVVEVAKAAKARGVRTSFDLNYRAKLASPEEARGHFEGVAPYLHTLIVAERDVRHILGLDGKAEEMVEKLHARHGLSVVVMTRPPEARESAVAFDGADFLSGEQCPAEVVDRLGAGDSFSAGIIWGLLQDDLSLAVRAATFLAATALATPGDFNWITRQELDAFLSGVTQAIQR